MAFVFLFVFICKKKIVRRGIITILKRWAKTEAVLTNGVCVV